MAPDVSQASASLLAANKRLHAMREQEVVAQAQTPALAPVPVDDTAAQEAVALPSHLGWGSTAITAVLRQNDVEQVAKQEPPWQQSLQEDFSSSSYNIDTVSQQETQPKQTQELDLSPDGSVKLYPDIGLGMLRQEMAAPGRLWLMLRYLDKEGRGSLRIDNTTTLLTERNSSLRLYGKRHLRNLLKHGETLFWHRDRHHIWLHSAAKVAAALSIEKLHGQPVALPVRAILEGIGAFRAHLYTAFHSGRSRETTTGKEAAPIARETLAELSGVGVSSQRTYEARVGVRVRSNYAIGQLATKERTEKQAWQRGSALFELKDFRGQQGKQGKVYLAWQLPNTYIGRHQPRPKGRQKRINRELKDLVMKGMPGNVASTNEKQKLEKRYYPNGKLAAKAYGRKPKQPLYWKDAGRENSRSDLWQQLGDG